VWASASTPWALRDVRASGSIDLRSGVSQSLFGQFNAGASLRVQTLGLTMGGRAAALQISLDAGAADLDLASFAAAGVGAAGASRFTADRLNLTGREVRITAGAEAGQSVEVLALDDIVVDARDRFIIQGGSGAQSHAALTTDGAMSITAGGGVRLQGGEGVGAYARVEGVGLIAPSDAMPLRVSAPSVVLQGGSQAGASAAIVTLGDLRINSTTLQLNPGAGLDADAVLVSTAGVVDALACTSCRLLTVMPLRNQATEAGVFGSRGAGVGGGTTGNAFVDLVRFAQTVQQTTTPAEDDDDKPGVGEAPICVAE
jgi:hypothetical protein